MDLLQEALLSILGSTPDNSLLPEEELQRQLAGRGFRNVAAQDITDSLCALDETHSLVTGFMETEGAIGFGVALREKIQQMPEGALVLVGADLSATST